MKRRSRLSLSRIARRPSREPAIGQQGRTVATVEQRQRSRRGAVAPEPRRWRIAAERRHVVREHRAHVAPTSPATKTSGCETLRSVSSHCTNPRSSSVSPEPASPGGRCVADGPDHDVGRNDRARVEPQPATREVGHAAPSAEPMLRRRSTRAASGLAPGCAGRQQVGLSIDQHDRGRGAVPLGAGLAMHRRSRSRGRRHRSRRS